MNSVNAMARVKPDLPDGDFDKAGGSFSGKFYGEANRRVDLSRPLALPKVFQEYRVSAARLKQQHRVPLFRIFT